MSAEAYPLDWPDAVPRRAPSARERARFSRARERVRFSDHTFTRQERVSVAEGLRRLRAALDKQQARNVVISSNMPLRQDGLPYSSRREPDDPGVAVYFRLGDDFLCLPCDTYDRVADNLCAVAAHIDATRAIERYGVATAATMYAGFRRLEAPREPSWWDILGVSSSATMTEVRSAFKRLRGRYHPDREHGDTEQYQRVLRAYDQACRQRAREV